MTSECGKRKCNEMSDQRTKIVAAKHICNEKIVKTKTTILDLNDDCLREICEYLALPDLCAFADVSMRFKQNAQASFKSSKFTDVTQNVWFNLEKRKRCSLLRNFGTSIGSLEVRKPKHLHRSAVAKFLHGTILRYCGDTLNALTLINFKIEEKIGEMLRPLLLRLRKFGIIECVCADSFLDMLPSCLPELRELELRSRTRNNRALLQTFPKLEDIAIDYLDKKQFATFLMKNQQLKRITVNNGISELFAILAKNLPLVESLTIYGEYDFRLQENTDLSKLSALKRFIIKSHMGYHSTPSISYNLAKMATAKIPIKYLELNGLLLNKMLFESISKFKMIETLRFVNIYLDERLDLEMCKNLCNLKELYLQAKRSTFKDLLKIIRNSEKLQRLYVYMPAIRRQKMIVDVDVYTKMVEALKFRIEKKRLEIFLMDKFYSVDVPEELRNENKHLISIEVTFNLIFGD